VSGCNVGQSLWFVYIHILSYYKLFLYFNVSGCWQSLMFVYIHIIFSYNRLFLYLNLWPSVMLDSLSSSFTSISFLTTSCFFTLICVQLQCWIVSCSFTSKLSILNEHLLKYNRTHSKFWDQCNRNYTETNEHYLLHCNQCSFKNYSVTWYKTYSMSWFEYFTITRSMSNTSK
jgi:hypothetical protein